MNLFSQTITLNGKIFSSTDNSPIENANIFVEKTNFGSTSNSSGEFQLFFDLKDIPNEITIIVDHIGFESTKINYNVNDNRNLDDVFLNPSVIQIEEVNVLSEKDDFELEIKANELTEKLSTDLATTLSCLLYTSPSPRD